MIEITGQIRNTIYHNEDNGFSILSIKMKNQRELVTVTGNCLEVFVGEQIVCEGEWVHHKTHGMQFNSKTIKTKEPDDIENIFIYLTSGILKGIGEGIAKKLIKKYGVEVFNVLDNNPEKILSIQGIGKNTYEKIIDSWEEKRLAPKIISELMSYNFNVDVAHKIYKYYGFSAIDTLKNNPYDLFKNIKEVSFELIDNIALKNGIEKNNPVRLITALMHSLREEQSTKGNLGLLKPDLLTNTYKILKNSVSFNDLEVVLESGIKLEHFHLMKKENIDFIQLYKTHLIESLIADKIFKVDKKNVLEKIKKEEKKTKIELTVEQKEAVIQTLSSKINIINGGPGVGKTTVLNMVIKILRSEGISNIKLCAPTGRAAKRMSESTNMPASTIHRLLEFNPQEGFVRNEKNKLDVDFLIIDEASMIDLFLCYHLLRALPNNVRILIVGDQNQLASVEAGAVLQDFINCDKINISKITKIHRQAEKSKIIKNAHLINEGKFIEYENKKDDDFFFISTTSDEKTLEVMKEILSNRLENAFKINPKDESQTLTTKHDGLLGTINLNKEIQNLLNPKKLDNELVRGNKTFRINDNVMQIKNNYDKFIFNGDMGIISDFTKNEVLSIFNDEEIVHELKELDQLTLSYVKTIHKSQGSEYPCVLIPISQNYIHLLDRSNLYTGITRGRVLVIVIGSRKNLDRAIKNQISRKRLTGLKEKIIERFK